MLRDERVVVEVRIRRVDAIDFATAHQVGRELSAIVADYATIAMARGAPRLEIVQPR